MASSRLEKVGTIFTRIKGLLRSGALKEEDKPMWYDIYKAFPPKYEPRYDRPAPDIPIRNLFYPEDVIRAKYHKENKYLPSVNLTDMNTRTETQKLISTYEKLKEEGNTKEEDLYVAAIDLMKTERNIAKDQQSVPRMDVSKTSIVSSFEEAQREKNTQAIKIVCKRIIDYFKGTFNDDVSKGGDSDSSDMGFLVSKRNLEYSKTYEWPNLQPNHQINVLSVSLKRCIWLYGHQASMVTILNPSKDVIYLFNSRGVDKVVKVFRAVAQYPSPTSARVMRTAAIENGVTIISGWSQRNLERGKTVKFQQTHFVDMSARKSSDMLPMDTSFELLSAISPSEQLRGVVKEIQMESNKKKQFLEVWKSQQLYKVFDLAALEIHGDVYCDGDFGSLDWSPCEEKLLYIAEKKLPKTEPFYKPKPQENKEDGHGNGKVLKGEEYVFRPDWGEQLVGKHQSVIMVCDMKSETIKELEGVPGHLTPGQVLWTPDGKGVVGVVWETEPRRLGLVYCTNRRGGIFHLAEDGTFTVISSYGQSVRAPRFSPDGKYLVWLERPSGGPHHGAHKLMCYHWETQQVKTIVDIVRHREPTVGGGAFYGLYCVDLPKRCWSEDSSRLLLSTPQRCSIKSYIISLDDGSITELGSPEGSQSVLDISNDIVVCSRSSMKEPSRLVLGKLPPKGNEGTMIWMCVTNWQTDPNLESLVCHYLTLSEEDEIDVPAACKTYSAIYFGPESAQDHEVPLIVWPHGGPHSAFADSFHMYHAFFGLLGFGMLLVNYRGSIGAGQDFVEFLPGRVGDTDVKDMYHATKEALTQFPFLNPNKLVLFGGSHGGFLVTHLSGQYPSLFKAVVARNPVIDIAAMASLTDIPDWNAVEAGFPYLETEEMSLEAFEKMKKCSPIHHVSNVVAPTLLMIGSKDKRVPSSQGIHYYYRLKSQNVKTRLMLYEDNHPLGQVPVEMDDLINSVLWFFQHIE